jgi:hypothetical protein
MDTNPQQRVDLARQILLSIGELAEMAVDCDLPRSYHALKEARRVVFEETRALR